MNWSALEAKILAVIMKAMKSLNERWVTAEVLCEHVGTLTPRFMKEHGQMFNRTRVEWTDKDGVEHTQAWIYPLYEIKEMIITGKIKELKETHKSDI
jgi:hypothetical protein